MVLVRHVRSRRMALVLRHTDDKVMVRPFDRSDRTEWWQHGDYVEESPIRPTPKIPQQSQQIPAEGEYADVSL